MIKKVAAYGSRKTAELLADTGIICNRLKIASAIGNANGALALQDEFGGLDGYFWSYVDGRPLQPQRQSMSEIPASTELSERMSKDLARRGFKFVGATIVYAFMQSAGLVNDHFTGCFRYADVRAMGEQD